MTYSAQQRLYRLGSEMRVKVSPTMTANSEYAVSVEDEPLTTNEMMAELAILEIQSKRSHL